MPFVNRFLSESDAKLVVAAIAEAEKKTSGEIRVHLENLCMGDPVVAAKKVFERLGMQNTKEKNGVLIYVATLSRKIAIIGDSGIHEKVPASYWQNMVETMIQAIKEHHPAEGLTKCITACGQELATYFPIKPGDTNELSNEISY